MDAVQVERGTKVSRVFAILAMARACGAGDAALVGRSATCGSSPRWPITSRWLSSGISSPATPGSCPSANRPMSAVGAYALFYLTGVWNMNVYLALLLAGPFRGIVCRSLSRSRCFGFAGRTCRRTWVVSEVFALSPV